MTLPELPPDQHHPGWTLPPPYPRPENDPPRTRFSLREVAMIGFGGSVLMGLLGSMLRTAYVSDSYQLLAMFCIFGLPIVTGLGGLLLRGLAGGVLGAIAGAMVVVILLANFG